MKIAHAVVKMARNVLVMSALALVAKSVHVMKIASADAKMGKNVLANVQLTKTNNRLQTVDKEKFDNGLFNFEKCVIMKLRDILDSNQIKQRYLVFLCKV